MSRPQSFMLLLLVGMMVTGCSNSLWIKWQGMQCVENCSEQDDPSLKVHFQQPVLQTFNMFIGELGCFIPVIWTWWKQRNATPVLAPDDVSGDDRLKLQGGKIFLFFLPSACDMAGTTLMNAGLLLIPVSTYQMVRGSLVVWVGVLSVVFLRRKLYSYQWLALTFAIMGIYIIGLSGSLSKSVGPISANQSGDPVKRVVALDAFVADESSKVVVGVLLILFAQLFIAAQFVVEEKVMVEYHVTPLAAVGLEGLFGIISLLIAMPFLYLLRGHSSYFDFLLGWRQMMSTPSILGASIATAISVCLFNILGLTVTRHVNATTRSTIDTCRTLLIWLFSLGLGWERLTWPFSLTQMIGFGLAVHGTFTFNNLISPPKFLQPRGDHNE